MPRLSAIHWVTWITPWPWMNFQSPGIPSIPAGISTWPSITPLPEAALAAFEQESDDEWRVKGTTLALYEQGKSDEFQEKFAELRAGWEDRWPIEIAHVYAWIGEVDEVFPLLEKGGVSEEQLKSIDFKVDLPE